MAPLLHTERLNAGAGTVQILFDLSMEIPRGKIVAVIGPNGAGKTMLARTIAGFARVFSGEIFLQGAPITSWPAERRANRGIASVPQGRGLFPMLSVQENLELAVFSRRRRLSRTQRSSLIEGAYTRFSVLRVRRRQKAGTLSGGEQQMLAIARALMLEPDLLLLDEPSTGLAPIIVEEIFSALRAIVDAGTCGCLLVEQRAAAALEISHFAYVLDRGEVAFAGAPSALLADDRLRDHYLGGSGLMGESEHK